MRLGSPSAWQCICAALLALGQTCSAKAQITADEVRTAIRQGCEYLLKDQSPRGSWDEFAQYPGAVTALCTLALVNSGVEPSHAKIQKSLAYLRNLELDKTYAVALQTMALCAAEPRRDLPLIQRNVEWLEKAQIVKGDRAGCWSYPQGPGDNSNAQFAVLALYEAERVGAKVDPQTWELAANYFKACQNPDGSWSYTGSGNGLGSMTCAGIGALVMCSEKVAAPAARFDEGSVRCCMPQVEDDSLDRAIGWLARNFSVTRNPGSTSPSQWHYYYLYGLERVGRLTARRFIGDHDWYREGAEYLISQQDRFNHRWMGGGHAEDQPHIATSLALLFLSKGRRPVLLAKVKHGPDVDWNNHPNDAAHLTSHAEKLWGLDMTWQIVDPHAATADDLLQAPVLFVSGSRAPELEGTETKVRDYIDRGGFLFAEACCVDGSRFETGLRAFMERVFPEPEYRLRRAGPEHPLWRVDQLVRPDSPYVGRLWTVEYGCRTCVVFSEVDLSCYWELHSVGRKGKFPEAVQLRIEDAMAIGANVLAYATNREPQGKEAGFDTPIASDVGNLAGRGTLRIARLLHGGGCNDAPGALGNLLRAATQGDLKLRVDTTDFPLSGSDPALRRFHLAFMHGRHNFRFTPAEREALRGYLEDGGTLFADAICASKEFATAFRRELALVVPDAPLERIAIDHPLFSDAAGGFDIRRVKRREPTAAGGAEQPLRAQVREVEPELEGIAMGDRLAVIFSPYDVSCALEQHEALQCRGYSRQDAARIGLNVVMYSLSPDAANP